MNKQEIITLITNTYVWFNKISDPEVKFCLDDLKNYFTPDFIMELNDKEITSDYNSLYEHFEEFRQSGDILKVQFPLQEIIISDDQKKCVAKYNITKTIRNHPDITIKVIAIWHLSEDEKLKRMNEVVHFGK